ncbi:transposable element Tcb2 transposase [Trichonephila clavipes]|nr:transposable element Tcb2 transposase [Trichonephila clavipes]
MEFHRKYANKPVEFWHNVLFEDMSNYNLFGCNGKIIVYRKPNVELEERNMSRVKYVGGGIMVCECMTASGVGNVVIIDGIMDHLYYIQFLKENLDAHAEKLGIEEDYLFYQDNDPKHFTHNTRFWLLYNCSKVIKALAQSPDLNPIEHLGSIFGKRLREGHFSNKCQMEIFREEWAKIDQEMTENLVKLMPQCLKEVIC